MSRAAPGAEKCPRPDGNRNRERSDRARATLTYRQQAVNAPSRGELISLVLVHGRALPGGGLFLGPFAMASGPPPTARKEPLDITNRSSSMGRDESILYRNENPQGSDPCHYRGLMRDEAGALFWIRAWVRTVKGKRVVEIRKTPKND